MDVRQAVSEATKTAMKAQDAARLGVLRMISAAIKDRDIAARGAGEESPVGAPVILGLMGKMVKQRQESAKAFRDGARLELAAKEEAEIAVIEEFLPQKLEGAALEAAIAKAISDAGASSLKDMGRVMALLKERHSGEMDFGAVGGVLKARLA